MINKLKRHFLSWPKNTIPTLIPLLNQKRNFKKYLRLIWYFLIENYELNTTKKLKCNNLLRIQQKSLMKKFIKEKDLRINQKLTGLILRNISTQSTYLKNKQWKILWMISISKSNIFKIKTNQKKSLLK